MDALDGNAIGGLLREVFRAEMTAAPGTCAACGNTAPVAEFVVYLRAPGIVARCRNCGNPLMVFVRKEATTCVDLRGLAALGTPPA